MSESKHTPKKSLFFGFEPKEGDEAQYVGCYILKWPFDLLGEPTIAFVEADTSVDEEIAADRDRLAAENAELLKKHRLSGADADKGWRDLKNGDIASAWTCFESIAQNAQEAIFKIAGSK